MVLTADSILARSTRRRQTSTGWNTDYIGANRYTLPPDEKPPTDDALPQPVLEHFSLNQLCQLDATAWRAHSMRLLPRAHCTGMAHVDFQPSRRRARRGRDRRR